MINEPLVWICAALFLFTIWLALSAVEIDRINRKIDNSLDEIERLNAECEVLQRQAVEELKGMGDTIKNIKNRMGL